MPVIGYLSSPSPDETAHLVAAFRRGLGENGFVEGQNVTIEYRWALGQYDRLPAMALELVRHPVTTTGSEPFGVPCQSGNFHHSDCFHDWRRSVKQGLVASYNRPGGNATELSHRTATRDAAQRNATWDDGVDPYTVGVPNFEVDRQLDVRPLLHR